MVVLCSITTPSSTTSSSSLITPSILHTSFSRSSHLPFHRHLHPSPISNVSRRHQQLFPQAQAQAQPRTLFPGGYKRPQLKVPTLILQLNPDQILTRGDDDDSLDLIDKAVSKSVGIVILTSNNEQSGGKLYEAACLLKSLIRDRAYLLVAERVDIAAAALTSGVLLSDQGSFSFTISPLLSINSK
jgi:hypothetical protein